MEIFQAHLLELRKKNHLTQPQVAEGVGITTRTYQRYEAGEREPNLSTLVALAKFYNVSLDYLAGLEE